MDIINIIKTGMSYIMTPKVISNNNDYTNLASKVTSRINKRGCYYNCRSDDISLFGLITVCIFGVLVFSFILYLFIVLIIGCCRKKKNRIDIEVDECDTIQTEYDPPTGEQSAGNQIEQQNYYPSHGYYCPPPGFYPPPPSFYPHGVPKTFRRGPAFPNYYYCPPPYYQAQGFSRPRPHPHPPHPPHPRPLNSPTSNFNNQHIPNESYELQQTENNSYHSQTNIYNEDSSPIENNDNNKTEAAINTETNAKTGNNEEKTSEN